MVYGVADIVPNEKDNNQMYVGRIMITGIFEVAMLLCFAASWPFNLVRSYRFGTAKGTSVMFMLIILAGYIFGIANKVVNDDINYVVAFYVLDLMLVTMGVLIYIRNRGLDKKKEIKARNGI